MIHTVGELGGMKAWTRFLKGYERTLEELKQMKALPC